MINQENTRLEGSGAHRLIQLIKKHGFNQDMKVHIASVVSVEPFAIRLVGDVFDIESDSLIVAQNLLSHERKISIDGGQISTMKVEALVTAGNEVIVLEIQDGQTYVVLDKVGE